MTPDPPRQFKYAEIHLPGVSLRASATEGNVRLAVPGDDRWVWDFNPGEALEVANAIRRMAQQADEWRTSA